MRPLALFTAAFGLLAPLAFGFTVTGYDPVRQYISELGAAGMPQAALVNYGIFLPTAILAAVTVVAIARRVARAQRVPVLLLLAVAVGNLGAAFVPCDAGCPAVGSPQQGWHNLIGLLQYGVGGVALCWLGRWQPRYVWAGGVVLACLFLMGGAGAAVRGLLQRVAEVCLFGAMPLLAVSGGFRATRVSGASTALIA